MTEKTLTVDELKAQVSDLVTRCAHPATAVLAVYEDINEAGETKLFCNAALHHADLSLEMSEIACTMVVLLTADQFTGDLQYLLRKFQATLEDLIDDADDDPRVGDSDDLKGLVN